MYRVCISKSESREYQTKPNLLTISRLEYIPLRAGYEKGKIYTDHAPILKVERLFP